MLKTIITEAANGTFSTVRNCGVTDDTTATNAEPTSGTEAEKFCYAVTSGHIDNF